MTPYFFHSFNKKSSTGWQWCNIKMSSGTSLKKRQPKTKCQRTKWKWVRNDWCSLNSIDAFKSDTVFALIPPPLLLSAPSFFKMRKGYILGLRTFKQKQWGQNHKKRKMWWTNWPTNQTMAGQTKNNKKHPKKMQFSERLWCNRIKKIVEIALIKSPFQYWTYFTKFSIQKRKEFCMKWNAMRSFPNKLWILNT